jgi:hypothetical protein
MSTWGPRAFLATATVVFLSLLSPAVYASDSRNAPTIGFYSSIDIADFYMFRSPSDSSKLVVAMTTQALSDPQFGPTYHFQENALYRLNFTTRKDARPTASIDFAFGPLANGPLCPAPLSPCQTFRAVFPHDVIVEGLTTQGTFAETHRAPAITTQGDIKVFAGPREDPFFFDYVGFNRSTASGANKFTGVDAFKGTNVSAIVVEFPIDMVFPPGACVGMASPVFATPCGAWASTYLGNLRRDRDNDDDSLEDHRGELRQLDREGNPLASALVPPALRDSFNFGRPKDDPTNFAGVMLNQVLVLDKEFGTCPPNATTLASCNPNAPLLASVLMPDTLKFASNFPDGFPNGRQLPDRVTDVLISLVLQVPGFTDGTSSKTYCAQFPYLGPPLQLSEHGPFQIVPQICP